MVKKKWKEEKEGKEPKMDGGMKNKRKIHSCRNEKNKNEWKKERKNG